MGLLTYSGTWGHLIMSLAAFAVGIYLIIDGYQTIGISLIATAAAGWFVPNAGKTVAHKVSVAVAAATIPMQGTTWRPSSSKVSGAFTPPVVVQKKPPTAG